MIRSRASVPVRSISILLPILVAAAAVAVRGADIADRIGSERLRAHIETLASDEYGGRAPGEGARKAAEHVARAFAEIGLAPAGEKGWFQDIPDGRDATKVRGRNVIGLLPGSDPALKREHVILSAHHDHLGKSAKGIFHGADDDATGVAAVIETARALKAGGAPPKRSVLFISFDLEEYGLEGSIRFVRHPTVPLTDIALFVNLDMLGHDMGGFLEGYLFALGTEHCPALKAVVRDAAAGVPLEVGFAGTDIIGIRGDYGPFREKKIPFLFFSTGEHPDYHRPTDTADRILYEKLHRGARIIARTVLAAADSAERPAWSEPKPDIDEARLLAGVVAQTMRKAKDLGLGDAEKLFLSLIGAKAGGIVARGAMTAVEREELKGVVQQMLEMFRRR